MDNAKVTAVRSIELGVTNLDRAAAFYRGVWGLEPVALENDSIHLRANGPEHHVVTLRERPKAAMLGVHFAARFGEEDTLFRLAAQLEEACPWANKRPPISAV